MRLGFWLHKYILNCVTGEVWIPYSWSSAPETDGRFKLKCFDHDKDWKKR